jgi:hypothetical protein
MQSKRPAPVEVSRNKRRLSTSASKSQRSPSGANLASDLPIRRGVEEILAIIVMISISSCGATASCAIPLKLRTEGGGESLKHTFESS